MPTDGQRNTCGRCSGAIRWIEAPTGGWWKHEIHPEDEHDAIPANLEGPPD